MGLAAAARSASGQVGGQTGAEGPALVDDVEDLDLVAGGVERAWISDFIWPAGDVLTTISLSGSNLTLAPGQSPIGALRATIPAQTNPLNPLSGGWINAGFGVPLPAEAGASTLVSPGNLSAFEALEFLACFEPNLTGRAFNVLLECYPGNPDGTFPTLYWRYFPASGRTFREVRIDLRSPSLIENNPQGLSVGELLSRTRFLYWHCFAGPVSLFAELRFQADDIAFFPFAKGATPTPTPTPTDEPTPTPTPTEKATPTPTPTDKPTPTPPSPRAAARRWRLYD